MATFITPASPLPRVWPCPRLSVPESRRGRVRIARKRTIRSSYHRSPSSPPDVPSLVQTILAAAADSDGGARMGAEARGALEKAIVTLGQVGRYRPNCLDDARLFGNYSVVYASDSQRVPAAGGAFRTAFARTLLPTTGLFQHVLPPDVVVNLVCFRLLHVLPGCVALKGVLSRVSEQSNVVSVHFGPPRIRLVNAVFEFGPMSRVQLATTYLDDALRLGVGSRGSLFVFAKDEKANSPLAQQWKYMFSARAWPAYTLLLAPMSLAAAFLVKAWVVRLVTLCGIFAIYSLLLLRGGQHRASGMS